MAARVICVIALLAALQASAASIKWTGIANNNQWDTKENWYPDQVPGPLDDVSIPSGNVIITTPVTVASLGMGTQFSQSANLTVDSSLSATQLTVDGNGYLIMESGASMVSGTINIGGTLVFKSGTASGVWTASSKATVILGSAGEKTFSGCGFTAQCDVSATGLVVLNQSSVVTLQGTTTASGNFLIQAQDTTAVLFDTSAGTLTYTGDGTFSVQAPVNLGTFNFNGGNMTLYDSITFSNSFDLHSGSVIKSVGTAAVSIPAGVSGNGLIHAEGQSFSLGNANFSGTINGLAGSVSFSSASYVGTLTVDGSTIVLANPVSVGALNLYSGAIQGGSTLTAAGGSIESPGFIVNGSMAFTGSVSCTGSVLAYTKAGKITVGQGATFSTTSSVQFTGPAGSAGFVNHGVLDASGAVSFQNIDVGGTGSVTVSDTLLVNTINFRQSIIALSGNGVFKGTNTDISGLSKITGSPAVAATIGSFSFSCPKECAKVSSVGIGATKFHFSTGSL